MSERCKHVEKNGFNCGSYAFNLYKDGIDQGNLCDVHYWQAKALAQPEQEPVATLDDLEQEIYENTRQFVSRDVMEWMLKRYYITPPQRTWVGLTDEEWDEMWIICGRPYLADWYNAAEAIEARLKDKNNA